MKNRKYVYRVDYASTRGWFLQIRKPESGNYIRKLFSDSRYGGKRKALQSAIAYRDSALRDLGLSHVLIRKANRGRTTTRNNQSGIIGVRCIKDKGLYPTWVASGSVHGKHWMRCFSISKHGEQEAFLLACKERYRRQGTLTVLDPKCLPCLPDVPFRKSENKK